MGLYYISVGPNRLLKHSYVLKPVLKEKYVACRKQYTKCQYVLGIPLVSNIKKK